MPQNSRNQFFTVKERLIIRVLKKIYQKSSAKKDEFMENKELQEQRESLGTEYYKIGQSELEQKNDKEAIRNFVYALCLHWDLCDVYLKLAKLSEEYKLYNLAASCYDLYIRHTKTRDLDIRKHYEELLYQLQNKLIINAEFDELYETPNRPDIDLLDYSNKVKKVYREVLEYGINSYFASIASFGLTGGYHPSILAQLLDIKHHVVKCGNSKGLKSRYSLKDMIKYNDIYQYFSENEYQLMKYLYFTALIYNEIPEESWE